jgi:anion-transporting  ArsA/GET3 family ATPase
MARTPVLDIDAMLADRHTRIVVCCGSGGVGKTTTAAALALRAAEAGREVVVLTIDPARRLAQSLGLTELDNVPRPVSGLAGDAVPGGRLDAMMLDMKRTFDEVVLAHSTREAAEQILANPFYQAVSSSFAGTQEYMAMEKLGQLRARADREGTWDLIVVDTPPSRSALDFLDAPKRLGSFLDGRFIRLIAAPAKMGGRAGLRLVNVGIGLVSKTLTTVLGGEMLRDVQTFVNALDTMFGGFRERADLTYALLKEGRDRVHRRRRPGAGRAARGQLLRGPAGAGGYAARRSRRQPDAALCRTGAHRGSGSGRCRAVGRGRPAGRSGRLEPACRGLGVGGAASQSGAPVHRRPPVDPGGRSGIVGARRPRCRRATRGRPPIGRPTVSARLP